MMPGLPVSSIPQGKYNRHEGTFRELFQAIGQFEPTFIEAHQVSNIICKVRSLKSQIKTHLFLEQILSSSKEGFKDLESDTPERIWQLGNSTRMSAETNVTVEEAAGS